MTGRQGQKADKQGHRADVRNGGDERRGFVGGALIDVRHPEMHGKGGQLEEKAAEDQDHGHHRGRRRGPGAQERGDPRQRGGAGQAEQVAHAVEHEPRGHDPKEDVLHARFHLHAHAAAVVTHGYQQVEGKGGEFQGDEDKDQFDCADHHHQAEHAEHLEHEVFRPHPGLDVLVVAGEGQQQGKGEADQQLEQLGKPIDHVGAVEQAVLGAEGQAGGREGREAHQEGGGPHQLFIGRLAQADHKEGKRSGQQHQFG